MKYFSLQLHVYKAACTLNVRAKRLQTVETILIKGKKSFESSWKILWLCSLKYDIYFTFINYKTLYDLQRKFVKLCHMLSLCCGYYSLGFQFCQARRINKSVTNYHWFKRRDIYTGSFLFILVGVYVVLYSSLASWTQHDQMSVRASADCLNNTLIYTGTLR